MDTPPPIRVQIADDHDLVRWGLQAALAEVNDIEVMRPILTNGRDLLKKIDAADVLLLDVSMPEFALLPALEQLRQRPKPHVIIITAQADHALVRSCLALGVSGYALKEDALSEVLPSMVRRVAAGGKWFSPAVSEFLLTHPVADHLSTQQIQVLQLMGQSQAPGEIARTLLLSMSTVYKTQQLLREALGAKNNADAVLIAMRQGLIRL